MARNTAIRTSQIEEGAVTEPKLDIYNSPTDNYVLSWNSAQGKFEWVVSAGGVTNLPDLGDVNFDSGTPTDNQVLTYDSASGKWKAENPAGGYVDKIEEGDSLIEVVDTGTGYIKFQVDNAEQYRLVDGKWYPITDNDIDIGDATHRIKDLYLVGNLSDGTNTATIANLKDAVDKKHSANADTDLDATFEATFVKKADNVNVLADISSAGADIEDAVTKKHTSGSESMIGDVGGTVGANTIGADKVTKTMINADVAGDGLAQAAGGELDVNVDDFTLKISGNELKIADRIEQNIMLNAFRVAINGSLTQFNMVDGIVDEFEDESGIDTGASTYEDYDSVNDLYKPESVSGLELDYMEYASDGAAQAAYVSAEAASLTKLLLRCNGNDESPDFPDDSISNHNVTAEGNAQVDTAQKKFGTGSGLLDGTGDYLTIPDSDDWHFGTGDFTVDCWIRFSSLTGTQGIWKQAADANNHVGLQWNGAAWGFYIIDSASALFALTGNDSISVDTWYHVAVVRNGDVWSIYRDGVLKASATDSVAYPDRSEAFQIGALGSGYYFSGHIDEFRVSKGIARWTEPFTPPTAEYILDEYFRLQCYSESTIKQQGSYSLKAIAQTDSLNDTLTKSGLSLDLSGKDELKVGVYASRTGTNFQLQIHDSGGQTSTKDIIISQANNWETITWDISGIDNGDKDNIDEIIIKIINADVINTFYVDNFYVPLESYNMTLISQSTAAEAQANTARIVLFEEDVDSITENTDLKAYVSRDGGTTWTQATLSDEGDYETGKRILTGIADISGQPAGTSMKWKIETLNIKSLKLHGIGELWD